jgi:hypothetical protein
MLALLATLALAQDAVVVSVAPHGQDRRWVLAEAKLAGPGPFRARDKESGMLLPAQGDGAVVRWLVPAIPAGAKRTYAVEKGEAAGATAMSVEEAGKELVVKGPDREVTRWRGADPRVNHKKPFFYPLNAHGVNVLRGYPMEDRAGEAKDHPHHTGIYHAFGEVNGREYWSKLPIENAKARHEAGPVFARIIAENRWGEDLLEVQDVLVLNAGADAVMDWTITLTAAAGPVTLGKDLKMAKEGSFAVRVASWLSDNAKKDPGMNLMVDSKGNRGEAAIRKDAAPWVDYVGAVEGRKVGVSVMDHPSSFRHPTNWHVRAYGLFAANPWIVRGANDLSKGESIALRYRVYVHSGDTAEGKVAETYAGFAHNKTSAE